MSDDLVKQLRAFARGCRGSMWQSRETTVRLCDDAADRIEDLEAEIVRLVRLNETTEARAEAAETLLSEVVRALINIERIYYMEAANPDPATIRRMAAQMNGVANTVLSSLSLESEEVARIMMTQAVRETQE